MSEHICKYCGKSFETSQKLGGHVAFCKKNPNYESTRNKVSLSRTHEIKEHIIICPKCGNEFIIKCSDKNFEKHNYKKFCSKSCANSHIVSDSTKQKISKGVNKFNIENPNVISGYKYYDKYHICKYCGKHFLWISKTDILKGYTEPNFNSSLYCSQECKHNYLSEHTGGPRPKSGFGKGGWYKGFYCDSSWELAFVIYHLDNGLYIERNKEPRKYIFENKEYNYYPDFITDEGIIEIKGYISDRWNAKLEYNQDIIVLYEDDIQFYLDYAKSKYGDNFISLYE